MTDSLDMENIVSNVLSHLLTLSPELSAVLNRSNGSVVVQLSYLTTDPRAYPSLTIESWQESVIMTFTDGTGAILQRMVFRKSKPPADDCICIAPYQKAPGPHHTRNCPQWRS